MEVDITAENIELPDEYEGLPTFAVGGWVRDRLRGAEPNDLDLMVAEVSPDEMRDRGFREIDSPNNDTFAVFQDSLGREVAIAREERSTGPSYTDFAVEPVAPDVPAHEAVERDLERRDFTVNAMALDVRWDVLHDPHGGLDDLEAGVLRHVSDAFRDDPLRILRGARFAARLDFRIAEETLNEMELFTHRIEDLPGERVRMEMEKAFKQAEEPRIFFDMLNIVDPGLEHTFPEVGALDGVPAGPPEHHEERDALHHTLMVLSEMHKLRPNDDLALLMALSHDLGKAQTPPEALPQHHGHGDRGLSPIGKMVNRLSMSNEQQRHMMEASRHHMKFHNMEEMRAATVLNLVKRLTSPDRMLDLAIADARGRKPSSDFDADLARERVSAAQQAMEEVGGKDLIEEGYDPEELGGEEFGNLVHQRRVERMRELHSRNGS